MHHRLGPSLRRLASQFQALQPSFVSIRYPEGVEVQQVRGPRWTGLGRAEPASLSTRVHDTLIGMFGGSVACPKPQWREVERSPGPPPSLPACKPIPCTWCASLQSV